MRRKHIAVIFLASLLANILCLMFGDRIVVDAGIRVLKLIRVVCLSATVISFLGMLVVTASDIIRSAAAKREEKRRLEKEQELIKDGKLVNSSVRMQLQEDLEWDWVSVKEEGQKCVDQLIQMATCRQKLHALLKENSAEALSDTEDVMFDAEQYMCQNVKKVLNFMSVADPGDFVVVEMIRSKLIRCEEENGVQLKQAQDFLFAITEFLNNRGEKEKSIDMLAVYKDTILKSLRQTE